MATLIGGLIERYCINRRQVSALQRELDIAGTNGMDPMPGFAHGARDRCKRHLLGEHQHQRFE
jgi:hypothetical protein